MTDAKPDIVAIFCGALERTSPEELARYLDGACSGDSALRAEVEELLHSHRAAGPFLGGPSGGGDTAIVPPGSEAAGTQVGRYKLLEEIGEGGFGVVYMAEQQQPVRRKVALKILKPGMDTRQVIARFEAERQALALMDHPHIARVFDAGATETGRPYFVMELVKGIPITDYCDERRLTPRERLELFVTVCQAVQHAHQKGIIHRDIKPTNVLITLRDDRPIVKVIDFGVAKATGGQQLTDKTMFTGFAQLVGTPLYMSPEQAALSAVDVDTRSDIYSLGVLLYELLTGTTPLDKARLKEVAYDEIRRIIQEEDPPRPSARISTLHNAGTTRLSTGHAERMQCTRASLGELDWIVMKALEKDRDRRYESAGALALDIERHLRDEPVHACPPSNWYRFRKFARRNKTVLATASVVGLAVVLALATLTVSTIVIGHQQQLTKTALQNETRAKSELAQTLDAAHAETYFQLITVAHRELSADYLGRALKALKACPEKLRGWEWDYLMRFSKVEPLILPGSKEVYGLAFSPDGEQIVSAGEDGLIRIRNSRTGGEVRTFRAHSDSIVAVTFHPDGKHLASVGFDQRIKVWDLTTDEELFDAPCHVTRKFGVAYVVAFSRDGRKLAAASHNLAKIWDWKNRPQDPERTFPLHEVHSAPVVFSRDGRLATATRKDGQQLWDAERGGPPLRTLPAHRHPISALAFSSDGGRLASASFDRTVQVWDTTTGELLYTLPHTGAVDCVAFSPDGRRLVSSGEDMTVRIWDLKTGREVLGLRGHTGRCGCLAFSPDGLRLASASMDGTIRVWDATPLRGDERQETMNFVQHTDDVYSVAISRNGWIASAGYDPLKVWDAQTGRVSPGFVRQTVVVFGLAWRPDGERIAAASSESQKHYVMVWDARTGEKAFEIPAEQVPFAVAYSPDGRHLVTGKIKGAVEVWDGETGQPVGLLDNHEREVRGLVFSRDGKHFVSASGDGTVRLWDGKRLDKTSLDDKQKPRRTFQARVPGQGVNVAFSPDGRRLATGGEENTVIIWDVESGDKIQTLWGKHSGEVYAVAFSPDEDGRWIATAGEDSAVKVWNSYTGKLIRNFRGHTDIVTSLAFSHDGRYLVSGSRDTTVKIWDLTQLSDEVRDRERIPQ